MTQNNKSIRNMEWQPMPVGTLKTFAFRLKFWRRIQITVLIGIILTGVLAAVLPYFHIAI